MQTEVVCTEIAPDHRIRRIDLKRKLHALPPLRKTRILHCVGHLLRGGIEMGLFNLLTSDSGRAFEHHVLVRTAKEEAFTAEFRAAGIPVHACTSYRNPVRYALDLRKLVQQSGPYDILHVHGSSFSGLLTLAFAKWCGIRWKVVHSHNDVRPPLANAGRVGRGYVRAVLAAYRWLADSGVAASTLAAESMFGVDWKKDPRWQLFYYGIDCRPFRKPSDPHLRRELGIPDSALVLGHVGRFHEQKNHFFLLDVVEATVRIDPSVICLLIGDGPLRAEFANQVHRRQLDAHFVFVPDTLSVAAYMTSVMDCFVFPSKYEGLGLVAVEAQAAGLPCILSDRVPAEAIVDPSIVTVLSLESGVATWAFAALKALGGPATSRLHALQQVEESRFNMTLSASTLAHLYRQIATQLNA